MGKGSFFYVIFSFLIDTVLLRLESPTHNTIIYNVLSFFTIVEYSIISYVIYAIIDNKTFRYIIIAGSAAFYGFSLYYYLSAEGNSFDSIAASVEAILIVTYSLFYLFDQMNRPQVIFIYQEPTFLFVVGFIIYFSGTLFLFIQANNLPREIRDNFWTINLFLIIIKNILFAIAFSTRKSRSIHFSGENPFDQDILENPYKT